MGLVEGAPHSDVTYKTIGLAMAVHNDLGPGHREVVYHRALAAKLREAEVDKAHPYPLMSDDIAQVIDYFAGINSEVALLINFGQRRLKWKRLFPPQKIREHRRKKWGKKLT